MNFDLNDYETVEERLQRYKKKYPDSRIITNILFQDENRVMIKAAVYMNAEDLQEDRVHATGIAEETRGEGYVNKTSHVENCETSAIGRALANCGYSGSKNGQRASREEMKKVAKAQKPELTPEEKEELQKNCEHKNTRDLVVQSGNNKGRPYLRCNDCGAFVKFTDEEEKVEVEDIPF